jgi:hypothetical protein
MQRKNILKQINAIQKSIDSLEKAHQRWPTNPPARQKDTKADRERPKETSPEVKPKGNVEDYFSSNPDAGTKQAMYKNEGDTAPATESTQDAASKARRRNEAAQDRQSVPAEPVIQRKPPYRTDVQQDVELDLKGDEIQGKLGPPKPAFQPDDSEDDSENGYPSNDETTPWTPSAKKDERADDDIDDDRMRNIDYSIDKGAGSSDYRGAREGTPDYIKNRDKAKAEIGRGDVKRKGPERVRVANRPTEDKPEETNFDMMRKAVEKLMRYGGN